MHPQKTLSLKDIAYKRIERFPDRPTIVFLHDSFGCIELWKDFPERLAEKVQCDAIIYDRQGYGKSCPFSYSQRDKKYLEREADILIRFLDEWGLDKVILFGHSDGGSISIYAAAKYSNRILGIITEGAHVFVEDITISGIEEAVKLYASTDLKSKLEKYHGDKTDDLFWAWANTWIDKNFRDWNMEAFLPMITCPSLIIQGEDDEYGTLEQVYKIVNSSKGNSQSLIIPNVKHSPHKEVPETIIEKTARYIEALTKDV